MKILRKIKVIKIQIKINKILQINNNMIQMKKLIKYNVKSNKI